MEEEGRGDIFQSPPQFESRLSRSKSPAKKYLVLIFSALVIVLLIFGITRFFAGSKENVNSQTPTPTIEAFPSDVPTPSEEAPTLSPTQKPTNTPTPKPTVNPIDKTTGLDRSKLSIHVLNGSGAIGASKKASEYLESLGYNVTQIGNAENFNYESTTIQIKSASENFLSLLKKDLGSNYTIGTTSANLGEDERADALVIVGKE